MTRKRQLALALAALGWAWAGQAVSAPVPDDLPNSYLYSFVGITNDLNASTFPLELEDFETSGTASVSGQLPSAPDPFAARGQGTAQYGVLGALAEAVLQAPPGQSSQGGYAAFAGAMFTDGFTITGGTGTAFTSTSLSGVIGPNADSLMAYAVLKSSAPFNDLDVLTNQLLYILATGQLPPGLELVQAAVASPGVPPSPLAQGSYTYQSGDTVYLAGVLLTYAEQNGSAVFSNTATFGITPGGPLTTTSGFVYAQAVPEPGTWAMMFAGLALLAFVARRRVARA